MQVQMVSVKKSHFEVDSLSPSYAAKTLSFPIKGCNSFCLQKISFQCGIQEF